MITSIDQLDLTKRYTYADYLIWQFDEKVELINGKVTLEPPPAILRSHDDILSALFSEIEKNLPPAVGKAFKAPSVVNLLDHDGNNIPVQPDIFVICDDKPALVVEVLEKGSVVADVKHKFELYQQNSILEYWIVYPLYLGVLPYDLKSGKFLYRSAYCHDDWLASSALRGFSVDLANVFRVY